MLLALAAGLSIAACSQTICSDGSTGNCESSIGPGSDAGDQGSCDDPNETSCSGVCVDTDVSPDYCGSCTNTCSEGQGCSAGACVDLCEPGLVNCGGECVDPNTNADFCGASGTCTGGNVGEDCGTNSCTGGSCVTQRYLGSLPANTGRWNYGATVGVTGAIEACQTLFATPDATICTFNNLLDAQIKGELVGATDTNQVPVTSWHIIDEAQNGAARQCVNTDAENLPWTYQTEHLGQGARFVTLNSSAGSISQVIDAPPSITAACGASRFVPCCNP